MKEVLITLSFIVILIPTILQIVLGRLRIFKNDNNRFTLLVVINVLLHLIFTLLSHYILPYCDNNNPNINTEECVEWAAFAMIPPSAVVFIILLGVIVFQSYKMGKNNHR
jgi:hypothetical protein